MDISSESIIRLHYNFRYTALANFFSYWNPQGFWRSLEEYFWKCRGRSCVFRLIFYVCAIVVEFQVSNAQCLSDTFINQFLSPLQDHILAVCILGRQCWQSVIFRNLVIFSWQVSRRAWLHDKSSSHSLHFDHLRLWLGTTRVKFLSYCFPGWYNTRSSWML